MDIIIFGERGYGGWNWQKIIDDVNSFSRIKKTMLSHYEYNLLAYEDNIIEFSNEKDYHLVELVNRHRESCLAIIECLKNANSIKDIHLFKIPHSYEELFIINDNVELAYNNES